MKPDIVVTHWPLDTHPNHHVVSSLVWQAYIRKGGWNLYFFEVMTDQQSIAFRPELYLDIEEVQDLKKRALDRHKSQDPEEIWDAHERMHRRRGSDAESSLPRLTCSWRPRRVVRCSRCRFSRGPFSPGDSRRRRPFSLSSSA